MPLFSEKKCEVRARDEDPTFFSMDPDPAQLKKNPDLTLNRNVEKNIFIF